LLITVSKTRLKDFASSLVPERGALEVVETLTLGRGRAAGFLVVVAILSP
jgi:hypothetical protein